VNGHRFPPSTATGLQVDYNAIPSAIVDRVEIIAIGGAPIYGSDAIAGTINIILRDDFEGLELTGSYGQSLEYDDATESQFSLAWGIPFAHGQGNFALTAQYDSVDALIATDRPDTAKVGEFRPPADPDSPFDFVLYDNLITAALSPGPMPVFFGNQFCFAVDCFGLFRNGIPLDIADPSSPLATFDEDGNLMPFIIGEPTGNPLFTNGGDGVNPAEISGLLAELERINVNAFLNYDIGGDLRLHAEAWFARTGAEQPVFDPFFNSNAFGGLPINAYGNVGQGPIPVLIDNPYLPDASRETILAALDVVHDFNGDGTADPTIDTDGDGAPDAVGFWRTGGLTNVIADNSFGSDQDTLRILLGLEGELGLLGSALNWDLSYSWSEVQSDDYRYAILQRNFEQAVQVTTDGNGNPVCVDPSGGCLPLNVLGRATPEAVAYVSTTITDQLTLNQQVLTANLAGDIFDLPGGALGFAAGLAFREEESRFKPDELAQSGLTRFGAVPSGGTFDTKEIYIEAVVPLLGGELDTPGVQALEFEGAYRLVNNSIAGTDPTWTAGLRYRPNESIEVRGNVTQSIRAPSIVELFRPESVVTQRAADPCDSRFIDSGNVPERRAANCAADGIVQPFDSFVAGPGQQGITSGNLDLKNETADAYTYGVILSPTFAEGLVVSVDYLNYKIRDVISFLSLQEIMETCYDGTAFPDEPLCDRFVRDAMGQVSDFRAGYENVDKVEASGIQTVATYDIGLERFGSLRLDLNYYHQLDGVILSGERNPVEPAGTIGFNEDAITLSGLWSFGDWSVYGQFRYLSGAVFSNADDETTRDVRSVDSWSVFNTAVSYQLNNRVMLQFNVGNLFDKGPPFAALASPRGLATYFPGVVGRTGRLSIRANF
jgi:outer membrane receptor protein involved in Fe transport